MKDYIQAEINNFAPTALNTVTLRVGSTYKDSHAVWLQSGNGTCYTTDPDVVSVSESGLVTALCAGEAFVVIRSGTGMYAIVRYTVVD